MKAMESGFYIKITFSLIIMENKVYNKKESEKTILAKTEEIE